MNNQQLVDYIRTGSLSGVIKDGIKRGRGYKLPLSIINDIKSAMKTTDNHDKESLYFIQATQSTLNDLGFNILSWFISAASTELSACGVLKDDLFSLSVLRDPYINPGYVLFHFFLNHADAANKPPKE